MLEQFMVAILNLAATILFAGSFSASIDFFVAWPIPPLMVMAYSCVVTLVFSG